jgi:hypothetical protein
MMMNSNFLPTRPPATYDSCANLVEECRKAWYNKTQRFAAPDYDMIDCRDLEGSREYLENVLEAWRS